MKSTNKYLLRVVALAVIMVLSSSCGIKLEDIKNSYDTNPYSDSRNESATMLGFEWNGTRFIQYTHRYMATKHTDVRWNIVEIDDEEFIIVQAYMASLGRADIGIPYIWLILPYQNVELNKKYYAGTPYFSIVKFRNGIFIIDGKETATLPLTITVEYTINKIQKTGNHIQGRFTAEGGVFEMKEQGTVSVYLNDGVFNLTGGNFEPSYTLEKWLKEMEQAQ